MANLVCVATIWIANVVCIGWAWLVYVVCIAWVFIVHYTCIGIAWIVYWVCRSPEAFFNLLLRIRLRALVLRQCLRPKDTPRNPLERAGWRLTFEDDFTSGVIDTSKWSDRPYYGTRYLDIGLASGITPTQYFDPASFAFGSSTVKLLAEKKNTSLQDPLYPYNNGWFTIPFSVGYLGWTSPSQDQQFGYFEIRCKIPGAPDMWPAFWLVSRQSWPPEIDIFEFYTKSSTKKFESTQHWGSEPNHPKQTRKHRVCSPSVHFHVYACEWTPTRIRWYYDNVLIRVATNGISDFIYPMHVVVNAGVDARSGHNPMSSTFPNAFEVDYVRAYA
ncbi:MAG TPA: glycoside hydrolase family 16 protein [Thermoanaerobaculia bacterium]